METVNSPFTQDQSSFSWRFEKWKWKFCISMIQNLTDQLNVGNFCFRILFYLMSSRNNLLDISPYNSENFTKSMHFFPQELSQNLSQIIITQIFLKNVLLVSSWSWLELEDTCWDMCVISDNVLIGFEYDGPNSDETMPLL